MLYAENIDVHIQDHKILNSIQLSIGSGESVLLVGANGAGKSTLIRALAGLQIVSSGSIWFDDALVQTSDPSNTRRLPSGEPETTSSDAVDPDPKDPRRSTPWRRGLGYVPQRAQLVGSASVLTNVIHGFAGFPGSWRCWSQAFTPGWMRQRALEWLDAVGLADRALQMAAALSGGEAQRCAIARALVREPTFVLADEPTASLDPHTRRDLHQLLHKVTTERDMAVVVSSHLADEAMEYFGRMVALQTGRVAFDLPCSDVTPGLLSRVYDSQ